MQPNYVKKECLGGKHDLRQARARDPNDERRNSERRRTDERREKEKEEKENAFKLISVNYIRARTR